MSKPIPGSEVALCHLWHPAYELERGVTVCGVKAMPAHEEDWNSIPIGEAGINWVTCPACRRSLIFKDILKQIELADLNPSDADTYQHLLGDKDAWREKISLITGSDRIDRFMKDVEHVYIQEDTYEEDDTCVIRVLRNHGVPVADE